MPDHVYKITEIVGTSGDSIAAAMRNGVAKASETLKGLDWVEVGQIRGRIEDGKLADYQVSMKIGFRLMSKEELGEDDD